MSEKRAIFKVLSTGRVVHYCSLFYIPKNVVYWLANRTVYTYLGSSDFCFLILEDKILGSINTWYLNDYSLFVRMNMYIMNYRENV